MSTTAKLDATQFLIICSEPSDEVLQQDNRSRLVYVSEASSSSTVSTGDLYLVAPGERIEPENFADLGMYLVAFAAELLVPMNERSNVYFYWLCNPLFFAFMNPPGVHTPLHVPPAEQTSWKARLLRLEAEMRGKGLGYEDAAKALLSLLLVDAARLSTEQFGTSPLEVQPLLARAFDVIEARFREPLSLSDVAAALHLTPAYLTTVVREATGRTVNTWIAERRMAEARRLLLQDDAYVALVGERVGYPDPAHFTRQFKRRHGLTPLQYRKQHSAI